MKLSIYKTIFEMGNFLFNFNLFFLIKHYYYFSRLNFYKNKKIFLEENIFINKFFFFFFFSNIYIKFNQKIIFFFILLFYNNYISLIFEINLKNEIKKLNLKKNINFFLSDIKKFLYFKTFFVCCNIGNNIIKHFGISFNRKIAENNSFRNLLKTILLQ